MPSSSSNLIRQVAHLPYYETNQYQIELARRLREHSFDIVPCNYRDRNLTPYSILHLHWLPVVAFDAFRRKRLLSLFSHIRNAKRNQIPIIWTVHNLYPHESKFRLMERLVNYRVAKRVNRFHLHSESAKQRVLAEFPHIPEEKVRVSHHPNYIDCYPEHQRDESRRNLGIPDANLCVLFFGNIRRYKGLESLIEAFRSVASPNITLLIAGKPKDSADEQYLKLEAEQTPNIIVNPEFIADEELGKYFAAADVCALPYKDILTSGAALLNMSFAKTCIAPRIGMFEELFSQDDTLFFDSDDPQGLEKMLRRAVEIKDDLPRMGQKQLTKAKEFSWERFSREIAGIYRDCLLD